MPEYPIPDYDNIVDVVPEGKQGVAEVQHFIVTPSMAKIHNRENRRNFVNHVEAGRFARLLIDGKLNMSDTLMERRTNARLVHFASGRVLLFGLGLGLVLRPLLLKRDVESVRVVELEQDVIDLVGSHYWHRKLQIVQGDAFTYKPAPGETFNTIYFDIWEKLGDHDIFLEQQELQARYRKYLQPHGDNWMDSWMSHEIADKFGF
jgi:spermidine synthase